MPIKLMLNFQEIMKFQYHFCKYFAVACNISKAKASIFWINLIGSQSSYLRTLKSGTLFEHDQESKASLMINKI